MPLDLLAAHGAGVQIHIEDLAAYLAGRDRADAAARWDELQPAYQDLAANVSQDWPPPAFVAIKGLVTEVWAS